MMLLVVAFLGAIGLSQMVKVGSVELKTKKPLEVAGIVETVEAVKDFVEDQQYIISINEEEAKALAQMAWGEARGCSTMEIAATMWCVLNRVDAGYGTVLEVISAPNQFHGYNKYHTVDERIYNLAVDVLTRWQMEKQGAIDVGRVLPQEYLWFVGDGKHNHFRNAYKNGTRWDWSLPNPYEETEG